MQLTLGSTVGLAHGGPIPRLGFGTYKAVGGDAHNAVRYALETGYRSIDTASLYGNEVEVGAAVRESGVERSELFITTKVWNDEQGYAQTKAAFANSLERLGMDYVDLYLMHWPVKGLVEPTWRAMEELLAAGKTRAIGVCNHLEVHLDALLSIAEVPPAVDQIEFHPWLQQPELETFLAENGIVLEAWAPVMRGHAPEEPVLVEIAESCGVTPAQVAIRWILDKGHVAIPKSVHASRIVENADVFGFELTEGHLHAIASLDRGQRFGPDPHNYG